MCSGLLLKQTIHTYKNEMRYDKVNRFAHKIVLLFPPILRDVSFLFFFSSRNCLLPSQKRKTKSVHVARLGFERGPEALRYDEQAQD